METSEGSPKLGTARRIWSDYLILAVSLAGLIWGLWIVSYGSNLMHGSIAFDTSVASKDGTDRIINQGLTNDRLVGMLYSATTAICGSIMAAASGTVFLLGLYSRR